MILAEDIYFSLDVGHFLGSSVTNDEKEMLKRFFEELRTTGINESQYKQVDEGLYIVLCGPFVITLSVNGKRVLVARIDYSEINEHVRT